MSEFGNRLKKMRVSLGYSQTSLAEKIGATKRQISYYECESSRLPAELLPKLAQALKVSVNVLLGTEEPKDDGRTVDAKFWPKWEQLTAEDKKIIIKLTDSLIVKNKLVS
jgi:transcriptional regulator with XRE-family HTH domain